MNELLSLFAKISGLGFAGMLFIALGGSYFDIWRWSKPVRDREAELKAQIVAMTSERNEWMDRYMRGRDVLGKAVNVASDSIKGTSNVGGV